MWIAQAKVTMGRNPLQLLLAATILGLAPGGCGDLDGPAQGFRQRPGDNNSAGPRQIIINGGAPLPDSGATPPGPALDGSAAPGFDTGTAPPPPTPDSGPPPSTDSCGHNATEQEVFKLLNAERVSRGLKAYTCDPCAVKAARGHSQYMCTTKVFSHYANGTPSSRCKAAGATFSSCGENIAWGYATPAEVHKGWMNSPGHRAAMLSTSFDRVGVGFVLCNGKTAYWTENFLK